MATTKINISIMQLYISQVPMKKERKNLKRSVKLKCCNVNGPLFSVHSDLMCLWDLRKGWGWFLFFLEIAEVFWGK